jgi:hypothetical protein
VGWELLNINWIQRQKIGKIGDLYIFGFKRLSSLQEGLLQVLRYGQLMRIVIMMK